MTAPHPDTDFTLLLHAYGTAADTPARLRDLVSRDERARARALLHLDSAIVHQGTPWTATGPVAAHVCALVGRDALPDARTLTGVLAFLHDVAQAAVLVADDLDGLAHPAGRDVDAEVAALLNGPDPEEGHDLIYEDAELADAVMARAVLSCREVLPAVAAAAAHALTHPDDQVRAAAEETAAMAREAADLVAAQRANTRSA
ncbi:hypothetical protein ACIPJQ_16910 [Streptomyces griseoviridis]